MKILCHECGASCSTPVPDKTVIRGYVMCPECISKVSSKTWAQFTAEAHQGKTSRFIETPDEEYTRNEDQTINFECKLKPEDIVRGPTSDTFEGYGSDKSVSGAPGVLTQEVIEEAAKLSRLQQRGIDAIVPPIDMSKRVLVNSDGEPLFPENVDIIEQLNPHDRAELRKFRKYVTMRAKYGDATLMKRKFWRKYLLGEK